MKELLKQKLMTIKCIGRKLRVLVTVCVNNMILKQICNVFVVNYILLLVLIVIVVQKIEN